MKAEENKQKSGLLFWQLSIIHGKSKIPNFIALFSDNVPETQTNQTLKNIWKLRTNHRIIKLSTATQ